MTRLVRLSAIVVVGVAVALVARPVAQGKAEITLRAAMEAETMKGDLKGAIALYEQAVAEAGPKSPVAAKALLGLGGSYQKSGTGDARAVYARIVRDYSEPKDVVSAARARLGASGTSRPRQEANPQRVLDVGAANLFNLSTNGRLAVGLERSASGGANILLYDVLQARATMLVAGSPSAYGGPPRLSNDGRRVAYEWFEQAAEAPRQWSLRIVGTDPGATPEVVVAPQAVRSVSPRGWSPDGKSLLVVVLRDRVPPYGNVTTRELAWLSLETKSLRTIKTFGDGNFDGKVSPDGRFIAFSAPPRPGSTDRYVYVMDANGQRETAVVTAAGWRSPPIWTPDGGHLLYAGDTAASGTALFSISVQEGEAVGEPSIVQAGFTGAPVGMTASGTFYYERTIGGGNYEFVAQRSPAPGDRALAFPGHYASWSRDDRLAFARTVGQGMERNVDLIIRNVNTGEERSYRREGLGRTGLGNGQPLWLNDGSGLIVLVNEGDGVSPTQAFYRLDVRSGTFRRLFAKDANGRIRSRVGAISLDDKTLYLTIRDSAATRTTGIVSVDLATGTESPVVTIAGGVGLPQSDSPGLALSPDGTTLAVMAQADAPGRARIFTVGVDGSNYREVAGPFPVTTVPNKIKWTPDGRTIVFVAVDPSNNFRVMRVPAEGGQPEFDGLEFATLVPLLSGIHLQPRTFSGFDLSPDGTRAIVSTGTIATTGLWTLDNLLAIVNSR